MPRGRSRGGVGHKGQRRHFSNPDQLEERKEKEEREKQWRQKRGEIDSDESDSDDSKSSSSEEEGEEAAAGSGEEGKESKAKGVQHLIEVENPNRVIKKEKKVTAIPETESGPTLSRREREEVEKQKAKAHYLKMHAAGKTAEAKADLARLAIIKQQREEAAKKRELEIKAKKEAEAAKTELTKKALGKKT